MEGSFWKNALTQARRSRRACEWIGALAVGGLVVLLPASSLAHGCTGDCDGDDVDKVSELVRSVRIALAQASLSTCPQIDADRDGGASINELLVAVNNAFTLCGHAVPNATLSATPTDPRPFTAPTPRGASSVIRPTVP